jgi:hypothetical protein
MKLRLPEEILTDTMKEKRAAPVAFLKLDGLIKKRK